MFFWPRLVAGALTVLLLAPYLLTWHPLSDRVLPVYLRDTPSASCHSSDSLSLWEHSFLLRTAVLLVASLPSVLRLSGLA